VSNTITLELAARSIIGISLALQIKITGNNEHNGLCQSKSFRDGFYGCAVLIQACFDHQKNSISHSALPYKLVFKRQDFG